ncbi:hypothetical protein, partial [Eubacterium sp.]|uniref:hypothetical protein n=1 Tax=Eubacterium sp. TaxID=142586 RepID=UPI003AB8B8D4
FWSAKADIFFSESLHSTLRFGRRKTIVSQTMCALAERLSPILYANTVSDKQHYQLCFFFAQKIL